MDEEPNHEEEIRKIGKDLVNGNYEHWYENNENKNWIVKEGDIVTKIEPREEPFTFTLQFANSNGEVYSNVDVIYDNSDGGVLSRFKGIPKHPGQVQVWKANKLLRDGPFGERVVWSDDLPWNWEQMEQKS